MFESKVLSALERFCQFRFISSAHAGFVPSSIHAKAQLVKKTRDAILIQMNSTFVQHTQADILVINKGQLPNSNFIL